MTVRLRGVSTRSHPLGVSRLDVTIHEAEIHVLVGDRASLILDVISGAVVPMLGTVAADDDDITNLVPRRRHLHGIRVVGGLAQFRNRTVQRTLEVAAHRSGLPAHERASSVLSWTPRLARYADTPVGNLPSDDLGMLAVLAAVAARPRLLLLNLATTSVDAADPALWVALTTAADIDHTASLVATRDDLPQDVTPPSVRVAQVRHRTYTTVDPVRGCVEPNSRPAHGADVGRTQLEPAHQNAVAAVTTDHEGDT